MGIIKINLDKMGGFLFGAILLILLVVLGLYIDNNPLQINKYNINRLKKECEF